MIDTGHVSNEQYRNLRNNYRRLEDSYSSLSMQNKDLHNQNKDLHGQNKDLYTRNIQLSNQDKDSLVIIQQLQNEVSYVRGQHDTLHTNYNRISAD